MGFLDDLKKATDSLADGINKAVSSATTSNPPPPGAAPPPGAPDALAPDALAPDALAPERVALRITSILGVAPGPVFGPPQRFERDGLAVARFTSTDGAYTVDVAAYTEARLLALGSPQAVVDEARTGLVTAAPAGPEFDLGLAGSQGPGHGAIVACLGDTGGRVDVYGPPNDALATVAHALLVDAWRRLD